MNNYALSADAEQDVIGIYLYSIKNFGLARADQYVSDMYDQFAALSKQPYSGKSCEEVAAGLRRLRHESHIIYYRIKRDDAFILRILHGRMDPGRHL